MYTLYNIHGQSTTCKFLKLLPFLLIFTSDICGSIQTYINDDQIGPKLHIM